MKSTVDRIARMLELIGAYVANHISLEELTLGIRHEIDKLDMESK